MLRFLFVLFIAVFSIVSCFLHFRMGTLNAKAERKEEIILIVTDRLKILLFYFSILWGALSAVKWYLGSPENSLYQSLWDILPVTFVHYTPVIVIIAIVVPIVFYLIFHDKRKKFIDRCISFEIGINFSSFFLFGTISNKWFTIGLILSGVIAMLLAFSKCEERYANSNAEFVFTINDHWPIFLLLSFINMFYYPNELYLGNISSFFNPFISYELALVVGTAIAFLLLIVMDLLLPQSISKVFCRGVFALSICCYLQGMFLNGKLTTMQGSPEEWAVAKCLINIAIWICILLLVIVLPFFFKKALMVYRYISFFMILMLSVTMLTLVFQNRAEFSKKYAGFSSDGAMELGTGNNVLVFILDMTDSTVMEKVIEDDPTFDNQLKDFCFYNNCVSRYSATPSSISYMLTGADMNVISEIPYREYAYNDEDAIIKRLYAKGVELDLYTSPDYIDESCYSLISNYSDDIVQKSYFGSTISTMWRTSMYRSMPFIVKNNYYYYSDNIEAMVDVGNKWSLDNDIFFYNMINDKGISVKDDSRDSFKLYHMRGAHYPYYLSEDVRIDTTHREVSVYTQTRGAMRIVYSYLEELKKAGVYDDTTIIITADHGAAKNKRSTYSIADGCMNGTCIPIMFVKMAGQTGEELVIDSTPISQGDMLATILDVYGLDYEGIGRRICDIEEDDDTPRYFYDDCISPVVRVEVLGDAHDVNNWNAAP